MEIGVFDIIALSSSLLSILTALIFLFVNRTESIPKIFLVVLNVALGYGIFISALLNSQQILSFPHLYRTALPVAMLQGPSIYYYILTSLIQPLRFPKKYFIHIIPTIAAFILFIPYYLMPAEQKIRLIEERYLNELNMIHGPDGFISGNNIGLIVAIYTMIYLFMAVRLVWRNRDEIQETDGSSLFWMFYICAIPGIIFALLFWASVDPSTSVYSYFFAGAGVANLSLVLFLFLRPDILYGALAGKIQNYEIKESRPEEPEEDTTYLTDEQISDYLSQLQSYMDSKRPFLNQKLRLNHLSENLKIPRHHLSWLLNNVIGMNFNDYINLNRLEYIKKNIRSSTFQRMTLEGMAYEAGFNSRTTFTHAVKKNHNMTPSEYFKPMLNTADHMK